MANNDKMMKEIDAYNKIANSPAVAAVQKQLDIFDKINASYDGLGISGYVLGADNIKEVKYHPIIRQRMICTP